jgi:hypothetical protein
VQINNLAGYSACIVVVALDVSSTVWCSVGVMFVDLNEVGCELGRPLL